jgi:hypothetical protein
VAAVTIYFEDENPGGFAPCVLRQPRDGERLELGPEFDHLLVKYGQPGVLQGWDHRGHAMMEVRQLDFGNLPPMEPGDHALLMRLIHTPQYVLIHVSGQKVSKPLTGHWVRSTEAREYARLGTMPKLGEMTR